LNINEKTGEALMVDNSGNFKVVQTGMKGSGTATDTKATAISDMAKTMTQLGGSDGTVNHTEWNEARQVWINAGKDAADFDAAFYDQYAATAVNNGWDSGYNVSKNYQAQ
jgi:hypothetical protein